MSTGRDPEAGFAVIERSVLAGEIDALVVALDVVAAALGESASSGGELGRDGGISGNPVGERVLAVLDDGLGCLVSVISSACLTRGNRGVVNELQQVLSVAGNDGELLAVLTEGIELVGVGGL